MQKIFYELFSGIWFYFTRNRILFMKARSPENSIKVLMLKLIFPSAMERGLEKFLIHGTLRIKSWNVMCFLINLNVKWITFLICFLGLYSTVCIYTSHCSKISNSVGEEGTGIVF